MSRPLALLALLLLLTACATADRADMESAPTPAPTPTPTVNPTPAPTASPASLPEGGGSAEPEGVSPTPSPTPTPTPTPDPERLRDDALRAQIAQMTLEDKAAAVFMVRPGHAGTLPVGGVIFMSQDVTSAEQVKRDIAALRAASPIPLFVGTDEEGGRVSRLGKLPGFPKAKAAASYGYDTEAVYADYRAVGQAMAELGFDLNFAPCADVLTNPQNTVIGDRSFGSDPALAADCVRQAARGLTDAGLLPVAKHFPGQGGTGGDSHTGAVTGEVDDGLLAPFRAALDLGGVPAAVMVGHITVNDAPATLDAELVSGLLRDELGFDGPVFTDALDMGAITDSHSPAEAAVLALQAGCDILLLPEDLAAAHRGVTDALISGELDESILDAALLRQFRLKGRA